MEIPDERETRATGEGVRALLVGDPERLDALVELLDRAFDDAAVARESTGDGGLTRLRQEPFDCLVVTDDLPETTCEAFLREVRDRDPDVAVVVAADNERVTRRAIDAGATDVIRGLIRAPPELVIRRLKLAVDAPASAAAAADDPDRGRRPPESRLEEVFGRITDAFFGLDEEWRFTYVNERAESLLDRSGDELRGRSVWEEFPEAVASTFYEQYHRAMDEQRPVGFEAYYSPLSTWFEVQAYPSETGLSVYFRDVTERKERERTLREMHRAVADPDADFEAKVESLLALGSEHLGTKYAGLSKVEDDEYRFVAVRAPDGAFEAGDTLPLSATYCEQVVATERRLDFGNVTEERPDLCDRGGYTELGIRCYLGAPVTVDGEFYGTLCFFGPEARADSFQEWELTLVDLLSQVVSYELTRREHERDLRDQREQLATINRHNRMLQDVTETLVETSSREVLEQQVCDHLARTDSYAFAWIGGVDRRQTTITPRAWAGDEGEYLGDVTITIDDSATGNGPSGTALKTGEIQVAQSIADDPQFEPWREAALERGFASAASIPITHEETTYGVLNVYASDPDAFGQRQRRLLGRLGTIVGHAISALERKRALLSDTAVELEFSLGDPPEVLAPILSGRATTLEIDRTIPIGDGRYVYFVTADEELDGQIERALGRLDTVEEVRRLGEGRARPTFEITASNPPLATALAAHDGRLRRATIDEGGYRLVAELPQKGDIRDLLNGIREVYPDAQMLAQRTVSADERTADRLRTALWDRLTDRQRVVLETAYFAGFYEWPRTTTGEQLADRLDISPATFTQHLRVAERKLLAGLFEGDRDGA